MSSLQGKFEHTLGAPDYAWEVLSDENIKHFCPKDLTAGQYIKAHEGREGVNTANRTLHIVTRNMYRYKEYVDSGGKFVKFARPWKYPVMSNTDWLSDDWTIIVNMNPSYYNMGIFRVIDVSDKYYVILRQVQSPPIL